MFFLKLILFTLHWHRLDLSMNLAGNLRYCYKIVSRRSASRVHIALPVLGLLLSRTPGRRLVSFARVCKFNDW